jgi:hypothetical protein
MEEPYGKIVGDVEKVINRRAECAQARFLLPHLLQMGEIPFPNLRTREQLLIAQNVSCLPDPRVGALERRPQRGGGVQSFSEELL